MSGPRIVKGAPRQRVVDALEDLLVEARAGDIVSMIVVHTRASGDTTWMIFKEDDAPVIQMIGELECAKWKLIQRIQGGT